MSQIKQAKTWATLLASEKAPASEAVVSIGSRFIGNPFQGGVAIRNDTAIPVRVQNILTSCGCSSASPINGEILPGESQVVFVQIERHESGEFQVGMSLQINGALREVQFRGETLRQVDKLDDRITFDESGTSQTSFGVFDQNLSAKAIKLQLRQGNGAIESTSVVDGRLVVSFSRKRDQPYSDHFIVVPQFDGKTLPEIVLPVRHLGIIRTIPRVIHLSSSSKECRLFLSGDVESLIGDSSTESQLNLKFHCVSEGESDGEILEVSGEFDASVRGTNLATLRGQNPFDHLPPGRYQVGVESNEEEFSFVLQIRE